MGGATNGGEGLSLQRRNERDFQPSGMSKSAPKQEVITMVPVTNARFNHWECPSVRARKKSPQWFQSRTRRSSIGNVHACAQARSHRHDFVSNRATQIGR